MPVPDVLRIPTPKPKKKEEKQLKFPIKNRKQLGIILGGVLLSVLFWWYVKLLLTTVFLGDFHITNVALMFGLVTLLFTIFIAYLGVSSIFFKSNSSTLGIYALFFAPYLVIFFPYSWFADFSLFTSLRTTGVIAGFVVIGYILFVIAFWLWGTKIRWIVDNQITPRIVFAVNHGIGGLISIFLILVSFSVYFHVTQTEDASSIVHNLERAQAFVMHQTLGFYVDEYSPNMTVESFLTNSLDTPFINSYIEGDIPSDPRIRKEIVNQVRIELEERLDTQINPLDTTDSLMTKIFNRYVGEFIERYTQIYSFALALVIFLLLKSLQPIYKVFIRLIALGLIKVYAVSGFIHIRDDAKTVKKLKLI